MRVCVSHNLDWITETLRSIQHEVGRLSSIVRKLEAAQVSLTPSTTLSDEESHFYTLTCTEFVVLESEMERFKKNAAKYTKHTQRDAGCLWYVTNSSQ
jgi:hypothetical protein